MYFLNKTHILHGSFANVGRRLMTKGEQLVLRTETTNCAYEVSRDFLEA